MWKGSLRIFVLLLTLGGMAQAQGTAPRATSAPSAATGPVKAPDCYCTDRKGKRVELGQTICLRVDGRAFLAQCQMSLNNPMWREIADSCVNS